VTAPAPAGFFGKIPAHGDFVRGNVGDPLAQRFTRWLEEASEACHRARVLLPREPIRFLFRPAGESRALVGALRASQDRVGRTFPLAVFVAAQGRLVERAFPALPFAYEGFHAAAEEVLRGDPNTPAALAERVAGLRPPGAEDEARAEASAADAAARPTRDAVPRLFPEGRGGGKPYAFHTFLAACAPLRGREPARAETVLDCPVADGADAWGWLELARRALRWEASPSWFERQGTPGRLLLSLGAPPPVVLSALGEPRRDSQKVWPLETTVASAAEAARKALGAARVAALEQEGATFGELAAKLAGGEA
jgi:type VI secretion system protein ImpM